MLMIIRVATLIHSPLKAVRSARYQHTSGN